MAINPPSPGEGKNSPAPSSSIRVLLVGNYVRDGQESMQRFANAMLHGLQARGVEVQLTRPAPVFGRFCRTSRSGLGKWLGYLDKFVLFPSRLKREIRRLRTGPRPGHGPDSLVVHICDHSNAIYTRHLGNVPHIVTCHDMLAIRSAHGEIPENPTRWSGRILQLLILRGLKNARHIACISTATERDLRRLANVTPAQASMIPNALNYAYAPVSRDEAAESARRTCAPVHQGGPGPGYVLHVGGNHWYKNRLGVLRIYARMVELSDHAPSLVMVGEPFTAEMREFIASRNLGGRVIPLHGCSNEALRSLYSAAGVLLFPSLAEGFGWPVIEAQACGCPVVCSDLQPLPEVAGHGAVFVDVADTDGFAECVQQVIGDADLRSRLIEQGLINVARYRPEAMIEGYLIRYAAEDCAAAEESRAPEPAHEMPVPV